MMAYFREHPALLAVCFCLFLTLFIVDKIHSEAQNFHIVQALDDLIEAAKKDEDVMSLTWCHTAGGFSRTVKAEVTEFPGESDADLQTRFEARVAYLENKYPPNC